MGPVRGLRPEAVGPLRSGLNTRSEGYARK